VKFRAALQGEVFVFGAVAETMKRGLVRASEEKGKNEFLVEVKTR
jgi:hypothetical protein